MFGQGFMDVLNMRIKCLFETALEGALQRQSTVTDLKKYFLGLTRTVLTILDANSLVLKMCWATGLTHADSESAYTREAFEADCFNKIFMFLTRGFLIYSRNCNIIFIK